MDKIIKSERYTLLDMLRGFSVISMVLYHTYWDIVYLYGFKNIFNKELYFVWQQSICFMFIFISGFCFSLGKRHLKRGLITVICGAVVSMITILFMPQSRIIFGILTFIGSAVLITWILYRLLAKVKPAAGFFISLALFILSYNLRSGYIGVGNWRFILPSELYGNIGGTYLGFMEKGFYSTDYFPMFPWLFLFLAGFFAFGFIGGKNALEKLPSVRLEPVNFMGRHALAIYMLHQPLVYFILRIIF